MLSARWERPTDKLPLVAECLLLRSFDPEAARESLLPPNSERWPAVIVPNDRHPDMIREYPEQKMNRKVRQVDASEAHTQRVEMVSCGMALGVIKGSGKFRPEPVSQFAGNPIVILQKLADLCRHFGIVENLPHTDRPTRFRNSSWEMAATAPESISSSRRRTSSSSALERGPGSSWIRNASKPSFSSKESSAACF